MLEALPKAEAQIKPELMESVLEVATTPCRNTREAGVQLRDLRRLTARTAGELGLAIGSAGTHPFAMWEDQRIVARPRYRDLVAALRFVARQELIFGVHVHVGVDDPDKAVHVANGMRVHVPLLLALSANSPFWQGRDTGLASARVPVFGTFPRVGIPRPFAGYAEYVEAIDVLLRCGAFPEPTFLWWDVRLQPRFGTIEVRIMDAQTRSVDNAALASLVQCAVRLEATEGYVAAAIAEHPEVLDENRFLATRDGMRAQFIDPEFERRRPAADILDGLLAACAPHAAELGCEAELAAVVGLAAEPGDHRQRLLAGVAQGEPVGPALGMLVSALANDFTAGLAQPAALA
jgi:glutamate---cysteine ligase / carboxylate-amine ligase